VDNPAFLYMLLPALAGYDRLSVENKEDQGF
jgi:hypothetical protein